jgi:NADH-quinone oxidoreductase subunit M
MDFVNGHLLSILIFLPLVAAVGALCIPGLPGVRLVAMGAAAVEFVLSLWMWVRFDAAIPGLQFAESYQWIPEFGIRYIVGVDGLNLLLVVLTAFLSLLVFAHQWPVEKNGQKAFLALLLALEGGMVGALVALDLVFFYIFWEAMLIPMYFIIGVFGGERRIYAATKFVIYTVAGSLLMLAALIVLYLVHYRQRGFYSTSLLDLYQVGLPAEAQTWMFLAAAVAFAIKVPMWPFHTWLPDAHVEAPTVGSVILAGVLLKMGTYGLLRFAIPLFPDAATQFAPWLMGLGIVGIIYGALMSWVQTDAKKLVAYSSVSHLGFVVVGSFAVAGGAMLSREALTGAVYQMINHGISTGALFFLIGVIYDRRHTRQLAEFGGLAKVMPWFAVMLIVATLGSVGLPGTGGFVGEFLILLGTFQVAPWAAVLSGLGVVLGAVYMLTLCRRILFGPLANEKNKTLPDLRWNEWAALAPLAVLVIAMGVVPNLFLAKVRPSIDHLATNYRHYRLIATPSEAPAGQVVVQREVTP